MRVARDYAVMPNCVNCGGEIQGGMRFCPNCGQDQSVVVPQEQRIPTEDVPVPPPPTDSPRWGGRRRWVIGLLGCGGLVALLLVALLVVAVVSGPPSQTAQSGGGGQDNDGSEEKEEKKPAKKKMSGPENVEVAVGETAELSDRTLIVNEVQHGYPPQRYQRLEPGTELLRVYVTLKNTSNQAFNYNLNNFQVQDSNGVQKNPTTVTDLPYRVEYGDLAAGGTMEGNIVYEVPEGDRNLKLVYEANPFQRQTITVGPLQ
jgi:hypothetical protein